MSVAGSRPPRGGPRAGDRLPDLPQGLQARTAGAGYHLFLDGPPGLWTAQRIARLTRGRGALLTVHRLGAEGGLWSGGAAHGLVRPDGYLGYVVRGARLDGLSAYLDRWLPR